MNEKGMTIIEILAAIVILSIIVVSLLSVFVQSARSNHVSKNIVDATYVAENEIEEVYSQIKASTSLGTLTTPAGYTEKSKTTENAVYEKSIPKHYIYLELISPAVPADPAVPAVGNPLVTVKVKVYKDHTKAVQEAQMEMVVQWKKQ
ncbi:prepilin-type N-terminal cleavage/methylation domain-containing protein [Neobacillus niacini]|uniref:type IV pilus modification PilV family protein n=1 Tax=Neobacillus niacini TaxID=86668 RepID=UPI0027811CD1|nr:type II secretion system protein [Neobacillus niacini]MDQ1001323.1 prepilin-type N-terminal cleavage/methylation domain-containing protein [Neobacillus niacini]